MLCDLLSRAADLDITERICGRPDDGSDPRDDVLRDGLEATDGLLLVPRLRTSRQRRTAEHRHCASPGQTLNGGSL